ncbi:DUF1353 domain-containing protein [Neomesorhizobium albiziae]|nr:DUF1353 domain-containing protein [Mesorhizobium albiziae]
MKRRNFILGLAAAASIPILPATRKAYAQQAGSFIGNVTARWNADGREMTLIEPFGYIDPSGKAWEVPVGTTVDGASIPQFFWSIIGGPFDGMYRNASVVHDFYCQVKTRPYRDVHRVFRDAMGTSGVSERKAFLMYHAVNRFGPRWDNVTVDPKCLVIDDHYDFAACSRNAAPALPVPELNRENLQAFIDDVEGNVDEQDIATLRDSLSEVR